MKETYRAHNQCYMLSFYLPDKTKRSPVKIILSKHASAKTQKCRATHYKKNVFALTSH